MWHRCWPIGWPHNDTVSSSNHGEKMLWKQSTIYMYILFFSSAWILESEIFPYVEFCDKFKKPSNRKGFQEAIREIEEDPSLSASSSLTKSPKRKRKRTDSTEQQVTNNKHVLILGINTMFYNLESRWSITSERSSCCSSTSHSTVWEFDWW